MSSSPEKPSAARARRPSGDIAFGDVIAGVGDEVEGLVARLPDGVEVIERAIADGADPEELALLLGSLPDEDEIEQLNEALDDPAVLDQLLAFRERETFKRRSSE